MTVAGEHLCGAQDYVVRCLNVSTERRNKVVNCASNLGFGIANIIGPRAFLNFITGRYHSPVEEDRFVLFVDIAGSTALAERLGGVGIHRFLDRTFRLLTLSVVDYRGEVLNYVGDEVIVTWPERGGVVDFRPLRCFVAMRDELSHASAASPGSVRALMEANYEIDVRHLLSTVQAPTLILHRAGDKLVPVKMGRYLAEHIPGAKYVEIPGTDHLVLDQETQDLIANEIEEFITGTHRLLEPDRVLATIMFTDIVRSTERAAELGDARWREVLSNYYAVLRKELAAFRGHEVNTTGDGLLATFDGPARAMRCARSVREKMQPLGLQVRTGLHTGECELIGGNVGGIAVHIAARVAAIAGPDGVMVSSTVKDLVAGSGLQFVDRDAYNLKGVPGEWRLFAVQ